MSYKGKKNHWLLALLRWLPFLKKEDEQKRASKILPTGITVERKKENGIEKIIVVEPETVGPINWEAVNNMHVIDPVHVIPTEPTFFISKEPLKSSGAWKSK